MTEIMSYDKAVLEIREEIANRDCFIISGSGTDMARVILMLEARRHTVWINADLGEIGVFKIGSSDVEAPGGTGTLIAITSMLAPMELGVVVSVPKVDGLPESLPLISSKDLISINNILPVVAAEAMRTLWPDTTVLRPGETVRTVPHIR